jgi:hypothetical protein
MEYSKVVNLLEYIKKQIEGDKHGWKKRKTRRIKKKTWKKD